MKLQALDQIHVSAVKPDALRPNEEFEVSDALGADLLKAHPNTFRAIESGQKAVTDPDNKALSAAPANKAVTARKAKSQAE